MRFQTLKLFLGFGDGEKPMYVSGIIYIATPNLLVFEKYRKKNETKLG